MRTMASAWFSVLVIIMIQKALGENYDVCLSVEKLDSCNECMRCGAVWCNEVGSLHCSRSEDDNRCPQGNLESPPQLDNAQTRNGEIFKPQYAEKTLYFGQSNLLDIEYTSTTTTPEVKVAFLNTTQNFKIAYDKTTECDSSGHCTTTINAKPDYSFCSADSKMYEYVYMTVNVENLAEEAIIKYHIPCVCQCNMYVERNSVHCNRHGDFSCGVCSCHDGWTGDNHCSPTRADTEQCTNPLKKDVLCSGNGYCKSNECICYEHLEGSLYFNPDAYCEDLCLYLSDECVDFCISNNILGECNCSMSKIMQLKMNTTVLGETDSKGRLVWVSCVGRTNNSEILYKAKKDETGQIIVMIEASHTNEIIGAASSIKVPIILGVFAVLAAAAAVAGVMLWKHMKVDPSMQANMPGYTNINAEDTVGVNPLYKEPISKFNNPIYGKY